MALKLSPLRVLLLAGASAVAVSTAAHAAPRILFSSGSGVAQGPIAPGQPVTSQGGVTQVQLDNGAVVSFVGPTTFSVGADGALEIQSGNITLGGGTGPTLIRLPGGGSLNASAGAAASFAISTTGTVAGQVMTGSATLASGGASQTFTSSQFFQAQAGAAPTQTFAGVAPQATPGVVGGGINIGGYNPVLNAAIQQNPALTTLPLGQSQTQLANYLVALGQTIGQLFTPAQLQQLAAQYGPQTPTPTPTTPTPTPTTPTPTPTTPTPTPTTPTPTPTTPTPTPTTPTPTPTTPTPTPTTPTPTPTTPTPTPTTPTPTPTTPANASGLTDGQTVPVVAWGRTTTNSEVAGTGDAGSYVVRLDASGNPNRFANATVTTASLVEVKSASGWTLGRYAGGNVEQTSGSTTNVRTFNANNGLVFAATVPVTGALPTSGVALYDSISTTTPILYDGSVAPGGSFTAKLGISLGTTRQLGFEGTLTLPQGAGTTAYTFTTAGGAAAPSVGTVYGSGQQLYFDGRAPVTNTGPLCAASDCLVFLRGGLGGADGRYAAALWELRQVASGLYPAGGGVIFDRTSVTTPTPTPTTPTPTPTTPTPTTPTPTPTTPTPTPTTPTPTPTTGVDGVSPPAGSSSMLVAKATLTEDAGYESDKATLVISAGSFDGYDINNGLTQFRRLGSQFSAEYYADKGVIGIARWAGGSGVLGSERGPTQGDHFVFGSKATNIPAAGLFTFDLLAYTQPTIRNQATTSTGSVSGRASVGYFGGRASNAGLDFTVLVNGSTYVVRSPGGLSAPSLTLGSNGVLSGNPFRITSGTGPACSGATCEVAYGGFLAGNAGSNLGLVYTIYNPSVSTTTNRVDGAVLFGNPTTSTQTAAAQFNQSFMSRTTPAAGTEGAPLGSRGVAISATGDVYDIASITRFLGSGTTFPDQFNADNGSGGTYAVSASSVSGLDQGGYIGRLGWVRWNGTAVVNGVTSSLTNIPIVWLTPLTGTAPTGRANYELMGATAPTVGSAQNGGTFKGALVVDFATSLVGWDTVLDMSGERLNFYSAGRLATPSVTLAALSNGQRRFSGSGLVAAESLACGGCTGTMTGLIGGPDASEAGVTYVVNSYFGPITGAAAFRREGGLGRITGAPVGGPVQGAYTNGSQISAGTYTNTQVSVTADGQARGLGDASRGTSSGAAKNIEFGGDGGQIGWTRWYDGTATVNGSSSRAYSVNNGVHLVWGAPVTNMPTTGVANYTLVGATKPTVDTFSTTTAPGEFAGTFAVDFGSLKAGLTSTVTMGATTYNLSSNGGSAAPSMAIDPTSGSFAVSTQVNGNLGNIYGFLAGPGASHAGVSYRFLTGTPNVYIAGAAAFKK